MPGAQKGRVDAPAICYSQTMSSYTFSGLSDADFEDLCADLLSAEFGVRLQKFTRGPDGGIDLLHEDGDNTTVVQCKHYAKSSFSALNRSVTKDERPKVERLSPSRYVVCTSLGLTPANKRVLVKVLQPYCHSTQDIFGSDDLNTLLRKYPLIEERHHKLWMTSSAALQRLLRAGSEVWRALEQEEIEHALKVFVPIPAFQAALAHLESHHVCVLSGVPGIGKTTLARVLIAHYVEKGYALVVARFDIRDALDSFRPGINQVILYDDFLGSSCLELGKNEDVALARLLEQARRSAGQTKVILTTREYILQEARSRFERIRQAPAFEIAKYVIDVGGYSRAVKARLLYNHLYFAGVRYDHLQALIADRSYKRIIDHENFSPRVIEWMTRRDGLRAVHPEKYSNEFLRNLDNPVEVWRTAFEEQLSPDDRLLLLCLATFRTAVRIGALERAWGESVGADTTPGERGRRFHASLKHLDGSFVRSEHTKFQVAVEFHNHSIADFVRRLIAADPRLALELLQNTVYFEQVRCLVCVDAFGGSTRPSGLIEGGRHLEDAVLRTISAGLQRIKTTSTDRGRMSATTLDDVPTVAFLTLPDESRYWWPRAYRAGSRVSDSIAWARYWNDESLLRVVCAATQSLLDQGLLLGEHSVRVTELLRALDGSNDLQTSYPRLAKGLIRAIESSLQESRLAEDWVVWGQMVLAPTKSIDLGDPEDWRRLAREFCEREGEWAVESIDETDPEAAVGELLDVAEAWNLNIDDLVNRIEDSRPECEGVTVTQDDDHKVTAPTMELGNGSEETIERLFNSLLTKRPE